MGMLEGGEGSMNKVRMKGKEGLYEKVVGGEVGRGGGEVLRGEEVMGWMGEMEEMGEFEGEEMEGDMEGKGEEGEEGFCEGGEVGGDGEEGR